MQYTKSTSSGTTPFVNAIKKTTIKAIASDSENRFDWWIQKTFEVLPTDPRYYDLTTEQRELLWEHYLIDNPEVAKKLKDTFYDPEFDEIWDAMAEEAQEGAEGSSGTPLDISDPEDVDVIESVYREFTAGDDELPDYKQVLKARGIVVDNENIDEIEDWEEV